MYKNFIPVADLSELPPGSLKKVSVQGKDYLLANVDGDLYAVDDTCSHEDFSLSYGCLEGDRIKCSLHGARFCLKTGQPKEEPADEPIGTYAVKLEGERICLDPSKPLNL